ncbi:DNA-binding protein, partial [Staphylococcus aureus]|nr:DNA-binding protein [Staphylococcus aureus]
MKINCDFIHCDTSLNKLYTQPSFYIVKSRLLCKMLYNVFTIST